MKFRFIILFFVCLLAIPAFAQIGRADDASGTEAIKARGNENRAQNEEAKREDKELREKVKEKKDNIKDLKSEVASEHRSAVANFVQNLLDVADRQELGGIGEQVREVAREQNDSEDKTTPKLEKIKNKNKISRFLFGADYKTIKEVKGELQDAKKQLDELEKTKDEMTNPFERLALQSQIDEIKKNVDNTLSEVEAEEGRFSLFGWVKKIFN